MQTYKYTGKLFDIKYSSVKIGELENLRVDSEFYDWYFLNKALILNKKYTEKIGDVSIVTDGEHGSPDLDPNSGIIYLSGHNIKDNVMMLENIRYCSYSLHQKNLRSKVELNNVLVSIVGTIGNASVVYREILGNTDRNVATIKNLSKIIYPYYLSTFLNSIYGKFQMDRQQTGNVQPLLNLTQLRNIQLPIPSDKFQELITTIIRKAHGYIDDSQSLYKEAEHLLLSELNLVDYQTKTKTIALQGGIEMQILENHATINYKTLQELDRFDAEYWDYSYFEIIEKIKEYTGGYDNLSNLVKISKKKITLDEEKTYNYIELADINKSNGMVENITEIIGKDLPSRARMKIEKGSVLFSSLEGSIDKVAIVDSDLPDLVASTGFFIFQEDILNKETLLVLLKIFGQNYIAREALGTIMSAISNNGIERILFPKINIEVQEIITKKIQQSFKAKKHSQHLLEVAKTGIEIYIEQDEEKGLEYIQSNI